MKDIVYLEYCFIMEPGTYAHLDLFEKSLADFFAEEGLEAQMITTIGGYRGRRMIYIRRKEIIASIKPYKINSPKVQLDKLRGKDERLNPKAKR